MGHLGEKKAYQIYKLLFARSLASVVVFEKRAIVVAQWQSPQGTEYSENCFAR